MSDKSASTSLDVTVECCGSSEFASMVIEVSVIRSDLELVVDEVGIGFCEASLA
jgi:hypothetical protein